MTSKNGRNRPVESSPATPAWQANLPRWYSALREVREAYRDRQEAERYERLMVANARAVRASWDAIGTVVGMTGEGARRHYGHRHTD